MKILKSNSKFLLLSFFYISLAILLKALTIQFSTTKFIAEYIAFLTMPAILFYLFISMKLIKHNPRGIILITSAVIFSELVKTSSVDLIFLIKLFAMIIGGLICGITLIGEGNTFFNQNTNNINNASK